MKIGIIGLGLIGGSLGLKLRDMKLVDCVSGYDINNTNEKDALKLGLVDEIISFEDMKKKCDLIFLAIPVEAIISILKELKDIPETTTIVDLGSTKAKILQECPVEIRANLIASHPMAGTENSGPKAAFKELLQGQVVVICEDDKTSGFHVKRAVELFSYAGMKIVFMDPIRHDHHAAFISHLPHVVSFSMVNSVLKEENKKNIINMSGGSFSDVSRIAKSSPEMWSDIFKQNKTNILDSIKSFKNELDICVDMIENDKWEQLKEWMNEARAIREFL